MLKIIRKKWMYIFVILFSAVALTISTAHAVTRGIDVSEWQGDINWDAVKQSGISFAMLRTSWGYEAPREGAVDEKLERNIREAKRVHMPIGAYHYCYATNIPEAIKEADFFLKQLKKTRWEYPVCLDLEDAKYQSSLPKTVLTDIAYTFMERVESQGYYVSLYSNLYWLNNKLDINRLDRFDKWVAQWYSRCEYSRCFGLWQFSSTGQVPGIRGNVDMDYAYKDYPSIMREAHKNGF